MGALLKNLAISSKIYSIVAVLLVIALAIGAIGVGAMKRYNAEAEAIINAADRAFIGEEMNALVYSVVSDSRGVYMSDSPAGAKKFADGLLATLQEFQQRVVELEKLTPPARRGELTELNAKADEFIRFRAELARLSQQVGVYEARQWGDNDANRANRKQLNELIDAAAKEIADEIGDHKASIEKLYTLALTAIIAVAVIGAFLGAVLAWIVAKFGIISPLRDIRSAMRKLADGNHDVEIPGEDRKDEVGAMAATVAVFKANAIEKKSLDEAQRKEQLAKEARQKKVDKLLSEFNTSAAAVVARVSSAATELSHTAEQMSGVAQRTSSQSGEVAAASTQTSQNVQSVASAAEEMAATVREIASQVSKSTDVVREAMAKVDAADHSSKELVKTSQSISAITAMIENIAEQINLLALNATIESARAGEAGKGFAVVASEVKNLASQATRATEQIRQQLDTVLKMSETVASELETVKLSVDKVNEYSSTIAAAVEEQSAATNEIVSNMQTAAMGVDQINRHVGDIRESANTTAESTHEVLDASKELSEQSEKLDSEVRSFIQNIQAA